MASRTKDLINTLERAGFVLKRHSKHLIYGCPCGHDLIVISGTKQKGSGDTNSYARISRILRTCNTNRSIAA